MIDFHGGYAEVWIENNGKMIPIEELFGRAVSFVTSISIRIGLMEIFNIEMKIDPPIDEAVTLLKSGKLGIGFTVNKGKSKDSSGGSITTIGLNKIACRLHYGGISSPVFKGILTMPQLEMGESGIEITLQGVGMLFDAVATSQGGKSVSGTKLNVIKQLLGSNVDVVTDASDSKLNEALGKVIEENVTLNNFEKAAQICESADCRIVYVGASDKDSKQKVEIFSLDKMRARVAANFVAFKQIAPESNVFPILGMSSPLTNLTLPNAAFGAKISYTDKSTGETKEVKAGKESYPTDKINSSDKSVAGGVDEDGSAGSDPAIARPDDQGGILGALSRSAQGGADAIKGIVHEYMNKTFNYNVRSVGVFNLLPGRQVHINVADIEQLSGNYDLVSVTHVLSQSGAETDMELIRMGGYVAGLGRKINETASSAIEKVKTKKPFGLEIQ